MSCVKVSALYEAWRPKKQRKTETKKFGFFVKFDSFDSIIRSIRSIINSVGVVDRPGGGSDGEDENLREGLFLHDLVDNSLIFDAAL